MAFIRFLVAMTVLIFIPILLIGIAYNIKKRKRTEEKLTKSEERYRKLIELSPEGIVVHKNGIIMYANSTAQKMLEDCYVSLIGRSIYDFIHLDDHSKSRERMSNIHGGDEIPITTMKLVKPTGEVLIAGVFSFLSDFDGTAAIMVFFRDITANKNAEDALRESELKYRLISDNMRDLISMMTTDGVVTYASPSYRTVLGVDPNWYVGQHFWDFVNEEDYPHVVEKYQEFLQTRQPARVEFRKPGIDSKIVYLDTEVVPIMSEEGEIEQILCVSRNITERIMAEKELKESKEQYRLIADYTIDLIKVVDLDGVVTFASPSHQTVLGISAQELVGNGAFHDLHPEDVPKMQQKFVDMIISNTPFTCEVRQQNKNGEDIWFEVKGTPVFDELGSVKHTIIVGREITERKYHEEQLRHLAYHDTLTGLPNRRLFETLLSKAIAKSSRGNTTFAVMYIDCDKFKQINDTMGHDVGDEFLKGFANRLEECVREGDVVARLGGDEFAVLILDVNHPKELIRIANRMLEQFQHQWCIKNYSFNTSSSIGIALYPEHARSAQELVQKADLALYLAKESGGNTFKLYNSEFNDQWLREIALEKDLKKAIENNQFFLMYQPQFDLKSGAVVGCEALLRWEHPQFGMISPAEFIPLAEKTGVILNLTKWVLQTACSQAREWETRGLKIPKIAVNVSALDFRQDMAKVVQDVLTTSGLESKRLELEITESAIMSEVDQTIEFLRVLKEIGILIAIDDFGTGNSSLAYLKIFPVDVLKIDRSFVKDISIDNKDMTLVRDIIQMSHNLQLKVVAEGVETDDQVTILGSLTCDIAQGYLFSKPLSTYEFEEFIIMYAEVAVAKINELEYRMANESARINQSRFESLFYHNPDLVVSLDMVGTILSINSVVKSVLGYAPEEVIGKPYTLFLNSINQEDDLERVRTALEGTSQSNELSLVHKNGKCVTLLVTQIPIVLRGKVVGVFGVCKDIATYSQKTLVPTNS